MRVLIAIAFGGSAGALLRYSVAHVVYSYMGKGFPYGTLFVNITGCWLMGFLTELLRQRFPLIVEYRAALLVGFLGAYTTFSSFAIETLSLMEEGEHRKVSVYIFASVLLCLVAVWSGLMIGRWAFSQTDSSMIEKNLFIHRWVVLIAMGIFLGILVELFFRFISLPPFIQVTILIFLLGSMTIFATLITWTTFYEPTHSTIITLSLFAINALGSILSLGAGVALARCSWMR